MASTLQCCCIINWLSTRKYILKKTVIILPVLGPYHSSHSNPPLPNWQSHPPPEPGSAQGLLMLKGFFFQLQVQAPGKVLLDKLDSKNAEMNVCACSGTLKSAPILQVEERQMDKNVKEM